MSPLPIQCWSCDSLLPASGGPNSLNPHTTNEHLAHSAHLHLYICFTSIICIWHCTFNICIQELNLPVLVHCTLLFGAIVGGDGAEHTGLSSIEQFDLLGGNNSFRHHATSLSSEPTFLDFEKHLQKRLYCDPAQGREANSLANRGSGWISEKSSESNCLQSFDQQLAVGLRSMASTG